MAGTINLSLTQQLDEYGQPLSGGALYIIQAGTVSTPQNAFQDTGLSIPLPNPIPLDAAGRIPQFFLADGLIKVRLQDKAGVVKFTADNLLVIGPSAGGGSGGASIDPTTVWQTGDMKVRYDVAIIPGFVRANGRTIGDNGSSGSELADPSAQALFQFLWGVDSTLQVYSGTTAVARGTNAAADWSNKRNIATPDWRGCLIGALDDMGSSPAGRLTAAYFGVAATVLGARGGNQSQTLAVANLPPYIPGGSITNGAITSTFSSNAGQVCLNNTKPGPSQFYGGNLFAELIQGSVSSTQATSTFAGTAQGGTSTPFATVSPAKLCTIYLKL